LRCVSGVITPVFLSEDVTRDEYQETCAICLSQGQDAAAWRFRVIAHLDGGQFALGVFTASPPTQGADPARVVAIATCPGARDWSVEVEDVAAVTGASCEVFLASSRCVGKPGLEFPNRRYKTLGGANGAVNVPAHQRVKSWSAFATAAGATVAVAGGVLNVPNGGSVGGQPGDALLGPLTITFTGTAGYELELEEV
jgi:hypothetical protein